MILWCLFYGGIKENERGDDHFLSRTHQAERKNTQLLNWRLVGRKEIRLLDCSFMERTICHQDRHEKRRKEERAGLLLKIGGTEATWLSSQARHQNVIIVHEKRCFFQHVWEWWRWCFRLIMKCIPYRNITSETLLVGHTKNVIQSKIIFALLLTFNPFAHIGRMFET